MTESGRLKLSDFFFLTVTLLLPALLEVNVISNGRVFVVSVLYLVFGRYHIYTLRHLLLYLLRRSHCKFLYHT